MGKFKTNKNYTLSHKMINNNLASSPKTRPSNSCSKPIEIRALNFELNNVGDIVAASKEQIVWHFTINSVIHKVELYNSVITKRKRLLVDHQEKFDSGRTVPWDNWQFSYDFW